MRGLGLILLAASACARIADPPGGPPDAVAPVLLGTAPDSLRSLPGFEDEVEFLFDEVVLEGGQPNFGLGTGDLERLVVLSPSTEVPVVRWRRDRITVRPREGWRPNTTYRVQLLAGVRDLRNNTARDGAVVTFTTGGPLPTDTLRGRVVDWGTARPVPNALVEAVLLPDSLSYRSTTDSTGRFVLGPLPRGAYRVAGVLDQNRNRRLDPREHFDSVRVAPGRDSVGELWAFRHDSTPARLQSVTHVDSVTASLTFTLQLDPYQRLMPDSVLVRQLPDSTPVPVRYALPQTAHDSVQRARRDSLARARDTTAADTAVRRPPVDSTPRPQVTGVRRPPADTTDRGPLTTRPALFDRLLLVMERPWVAGTRYVVDLFGLRTVSGIAGSARAVLVVPAARASGDSLAATRSDSTGAARPDSTRSAPPDSGQRRGTGRPRS